MSIIFTNHMMIIQFINFILKYFYFFKNMIGLTENLNCVLSSENMLLDELKKLLTDSKLSVIDVFEIIHSLINNNEITDKEALKVIDELIEVDLLNEDDLINF